MGWSFDAYPSDKTKAEFVEELLRARHVIDHAVVGHNLWCVITIQHDGVERRLVTLDILKRDRGCWGNKSISEDMGPYETNCPLRLLDLAGEPINKYAAEWRDNVRRAHARRANRRKLAAKLRCGDQVRQAGVDDVFTIIDTEYRGDGRKRPIIIGRSEKDGGLYKISKTRLEPA